MAARVLSRTGHLQQSPGRWPGPRIAAGSGPVSYSGFVSLGFGGRVTVDLGGCLADRPGPDIRVYQAVFSEPVTVYASAAPDGPYALLEALKACGTPFEGCRALRVRPCERRPGAARFRRAQRQTLPCPGGTKTEGADLDAVQVLGATTMGADPSDADRR